MQDEAKFDASMMLGEAMQNKNEEVNTSPE